MHGRETVAQLIDRGQASPDLQEAEEHAERRYQSHPRPVAERQTKHAMGGRGRKSEVENEGHNPPVSSKNSCVLKGAALMNKNRCSKAGPESAWVDMAPDTFS